VEPDLHIITYKLTAVGTLGLIWITVAGVVRKEKHLEKVVDFFVGVVLGAFRFHAALAMANHHALVWWGRYLQAYWAELKMKEARELGAARSSEPLEIKDK
jgi:hypothetical protein